MKYIFLLLFSILFLGCQQEETVTIPEPLVIAFGSCNNQDMHNPMWEPITKHNPDVFIWLGDNIYGDSENIDTLKKAYKIQDGKVDYKLFKATSTEIIGTWDDHDYGLNDGGKNWALKGESKNLLLNFLDVPEYAEVRQREGVYQSFTYGEGKYSVKVILLDTRYFRDDLLLDTNENKVYAPNKNGDILGREQWQWLENELKINTSTVTIIGSSIQVLANQHGWERWGELPTSRDRLFSIINKYKPENLLILSGDRHVAEVSKSTSKSPVFYDITSSGMTHVYYPKEEENKYRISPFIKSRNWGLLTIDWAKKDSLIQLEIRGEADSLFYSSTLAF